MHRRILLIAIIGLLLFVAILFVSFVVQPLLPAPLNSTVIIVFAALVAVLGIVGSVIGIYDFVQKKREEESGQKHILISEQLPVRKLDTTTTPSSSRPLIVKAQFLNTVSDESDCDELETRVQELIQFVERYNRGSEFTKRIERLTSRPRLLLSFGDYENEFEAKIRQEGYDQQYRDKLRTNRDEIRQVLEDLIEIERS